MSKRKKTLPAIDSITACHITAYLTLQAVPCVKIEDIEKHIAPDHSTHRSFMISIAYELRMFLILLMHFYFQIRLEERGLKQAGSTSKYFDKFAKIIQGNILYKEEIDYLKSINPNNPASAIAHVELGDDTVFKIILATRAEEYYTSLPALLDSEQLLAELTTLLKHILDRTWFIDYGAPKPTEMNVMAWTIITSYMTGALNHLDNLLSQFDSTDILAYIIHQNEERMAQSK